MHILKHKKGMSLPTVLGIVTFLIGTTATFLSYIVFQSRVVDQSLERTESYQNAMIRMETALNIMARENNFDPTFLSELEAYLNVTIEAQNSSLYMVTTALSRTTLKSYITSSAISVNTADTIFDFTGQENDFFLSPLVTPTTLLTSYMPSYMDTYLPDAPQESFLSFQDVIDYVQNLASNNQGFSIYTNADLENGASLSDHAYVNGNVTIKRNKLLRIEDNKVLVINGDLTLERGADIEGNFIVNGNFLVKNQGNDYQSIIATLYVYGTVDINKQTTFGTLIRPTFIFTEKSMEIDNQTTGIAYFMAESLIAKQGNIALTGGVYVMDPDASTIKPIVESNQDLDESLFFDQAIPDVVVVESTDPETGTSEGVKFTSPKLS